MKKLSTFLGIICLFFVMLLLFLVELIVGLLLILIGTIISRLGEFIMTAGEIVANGMDNWKDQLSDKYHEWFGPKSPKKTKAPLKGIIPRNWFDEL